MDAVILSGAVVISTAVCVACVLATCCIVGSWTWSTYKQLFRISSSPLIAIPEAEATVTVTATATATTDGAHEIRIDAEELEERLRLIRGCSDHQWANGAPPESTSSNRLWARSIQQQWDMLKDGLPPSISVVAYEDRIDLMRAVIVGPQGTPYQDGLFFFDITFPPAYPGSPPLVHFHSHGLRVNPNLYANGTVCLSLLNTWNGSSDEKWIPNKSTVLQILVSIQGLVLNEKPIFNEPGLRAVSWVFWSFSQSYGEVALLESSKLMVYTMRTPPQHFEELVRRHFRGRATAIMEACRSQQMTDSERKTQMESLLPVLEDEFRKIGSDHGQCSAVGQH